MTKDGEPEVTKWEGMKYLEEKKLYLKIKERLSSIVVGSYKVIWGQCSKKVQNRVRAHEDFREVKKNHKVDKILKIIKDI